MFNTCLHYDLSFLEPGNMWPNFTDKYRIDCYRFAREEFEMTPEDMTHRILPTGMLRFAEYKDFVDVTRLLNYPRLLTLKTVDMVVGQPPLITAQAKDDMTEKIKDLRMSSQFDVVMRQALIDYSRFGVFLLRVFKDKKGRAQLTAWDPMDWTPVFYPDGTHRIHYNVIGWRYKDRLTVQIHDTEDGSYEERVYATDSAATIISLISTKTYNKNSGKQLLFAVTNTPTTTNPLGTSDYKIINGLLQKAIERLQAILRVLDEHADPSMVGPHTLLDKDEHGELVFRTSRYYAVGNEEQKPEYLVWEANLDSSFQAFNELCKQIYILSEMGEAFIGAPEGSANVVSGTAMRFKMISPLEKARRISSAMTTPLQEVISAMLSIEGEKLEAKDINITWRDSLPKDPREVAELTRLEAGSVAVKPLLHAIMDNYDMDMDSAQQYVDEIIEYQELQGSVNQTESSDGVENDSGLDARSQEASGSINPRKHGSAMDPASSENKGDDQNARLK